MQTGGGDMQFCVRTNGNARNLHARPVLRTRTRDATHGHILPAQRLARHTAMSKDASGGECLRVCITLVGTPPMRIINDYIDQICTTFTSVLEQHRMTGTFRVRVRAELKNKMTTADLHKKMAHTLGVRDELMSVERDTGPHRSDEWIRSLGHVIIDGPYVNGRRISADYSGQDLRSIDDAPTALQREILDLLETTPDPRKVVWYWGDRRIPGCAEDMDRTIKYCAWRKLACVPRVSRAERMRAQLHRVGSHQAYIFDARSEAFRRNERECMDFARDLKAGLVLSNVDERDEMDLFSPPHVIFMSYRPAPRKMLEDDQWHVRTIVKDRSRS